MYKTIFTFALLLNVAITATAQSPATGQILGHDYVDLGLSVMWATCNIGASSPSDYGDYFAWGEAETKTEYTEENSATYGKDSYTFLDAASAQWGSTWRMPTEAECRELIDKCTWQWTTVGGHEGYRVTSKKNGNSIFLPATGVYVPRRESTPETGNSGYYWSSSCYGNEYNYAHSIYTSILPRSICSIQRPRSYGLSIRPVFDTISEQEKNKLSTIITGQISGHDYVDLGLSVMWATCNIGASSPSDYGDYFAWGEAETKAEYAFDNSATYKKHRITFIDAATTNWGWQWRMPTEAEFKELLINCFWRCITVDGHNGYKVTGPNGNSIFLPAAGYREYNQLYNDASGWMGYYWSSSSYEKNKKDDGAITFYFSDDRRFVNWSFRCYGLVIRPVLK